MKISVIPKLAERLSVAQVKSLAVGRESGARQLLYSSKGRGGRGPGGDGAAGTGSAGKQDPALHPPRAWYPPAPHGRAAQFPNSRIGNALGKLHEFCCCNSLYGQHVASPKPWLGTCTFVKALMNQEWIFPVFYKSAWQTQKVHSQLHLPTLPPSYCSLGLPPIRAPVPAVWVEASSQPSNTLLFPVHRLYKAMGICFTSLFWVPVPSWTLFGLPGA